MAALQALGAALATAGVVLTGVVSTAGARGPAGRPRGRVLAVVSLLLFTVLTVGMATPIRPAGWLPVVLGTRLANAVTVVAVLLVVLRFRPRGSWILLRPPGRVAAPGAWTRRRGLLDVVGLAFAIGLEVRSTWIVGLASSFGPAVAVVVAVALWGERLRASQWLGLVGIAAGLARRPAEVRRRPERVDGIEHLF